jgi:hypothetical protein
VPIPALPDSGSGPLLTPDDLTPFAEIEAVKAQAMIDDALARAARVAPCIRDETLSADNAQAAKGVIRDAILRKNEAGSGALAAQAVGPFGQTIDTRQPQRALFWPSEVEELQAICRDHSGVASSGAFSIDTAPTYAGSGHNDTCALNFGATYCSCGYVLTAGIPLYGA